MSRNLKISVLFIAITAAAAAAFFALDPASRLPALAVSRTSEGRDDHAAPQAAGDRHDHHAAEAEPGHGSEHGGGSMCGEHDVAENECGICQPNLAAGLSPGEGLKIRLASAESASRAGVRIAAPEYEDMAQVVECYAEIMFDQNRTAVVVAPAEGVVDEVNVDLGTRVREGDVLATLSSATIAEAQSEYLRALSEARLCEQAHARERALFADRVTSEKDVQEAAAAREAANAALQQARKHLRVLGFDDARIDRLGDSNGVLELKAPFSGEIITRDAVRGARIESGVTLFTIADRSTMWGMLSIPEAQLSRVHVGERVVFEPETSRGLRDSRGSHGETFEGRITWISPRIDPRTRMTQARAEIRDGALALRSGSFARARIETTEGGRALIVPEAAVQRVENKPFVFVRLADDLYEARAVELGAGRDGRVEITAGLQATDQIAVAQSFTIKSELLKSRLGAGCADD